MQEHFFTYKDSLIRYTRMGEGPEILLCFHGYGETSDSFLFLSEYIGNQFTVFTIDLPFHGKTQWREGLLFEETDLVAITAGILGKDGSQKGPRFTLLGFSLGGRVSLCLYQARPEWVYKLVLLAPDGLKVNFWYWLATRTYPGNRFFRFTMKRPYWFYGFLKLMNRVGLVNASIFKFVNYYIGNSEVRELLYARWTSLRKLRPDKRKIRDLVRTNNTPVDLVYGLHDRIILSSVGVRFRKGIEEQCRLTVIKAGHQVLHEKHATEIMQALRG